MFYIGIDVAKNNHEVTIIDEKGELLSESISFSNTQKACEKFIKSIEHFDSAFVNKESKNPFILPIQNSFAKLNITSILSGVYIIILSINSSTTSCVSCSMAEISSSAFGSLSI